MTTPVFYKLPLVGGKFQDSAGNYLSLGWLEWRLNHDSNIAILGGPSGSQIVSGLPIKVCLDQNGSAISGTSIWPNDQLTPAGSYYTVRAFNNQGLDVWNFPQVFTIAGYASGQSVDLGTLQPVSP